MLVIPNYAYVSGCTTVILALDTWISPTCWMLAGGHRVDSVVAWLTCHGQSYLVFNLVFCSGVLGGTSGGCRSAGA